MLANYFDTSALGKHYHSEVGTARVDEFLQDPNAKAHISRLTTVEMLSVFAGKVRSNVVSPADYGLLRKRFHADLARRRFAVVRLTNARFQEAERLIAAHGMTQQLRTLDALQLASALALKNTATQVQFVCADKRLLGIAVQEGLVAINPETG